MNMLIITRAVSFARIILQSSLSKTENSMRSISYSAIWLKEENKELENNAHENTVEKEGIAEVRDPSKDRSVPVSPETSIRYMNSAAYKQTYGDDPVWKMYRRNYKGQFAPIKTRKTCIRGGIISTGNPCPICRDEYLVLDHKNVKLLKQFICEDTGSVLSYRKTGICQSKHKKLLVALYRAKDYGTIMFDVPLRQYDYSEWYNEDKQIQ